MAEETKEDTPPPLATETMKPEEATALGDIYSAVGYSAAELLPSLIGVPKDWAESAKQRRLIREGVLFCDNPSWDEAKPRWVLLFTDCLVITKPDCEWSDDFELLNPDSSSLRATSSGSKGTSGKTSKHTKRLSGMRSLWKRGKKQKKGGSSEVDSAASSASSSSSSASAETGVTSEQLNEDATATSEEGGGSHGKSDATLALEAAHSSGIVRGIAVGSKEVIVKFRMKQLFSLQSVFLNESKKFCEEKNQSTHPSFSSEIFAISGQCRVMSDLTRSLSSEERSVTLVCSAKTPARRELWMQRIHECIVSSVDPSTQSDYGWQSGRRLGSLHSAVLRKSKAQISELITTGQAIVDDQKDVGGHTVLHLACAAGFDWFVDIYGGQCDPLIADPRGDSALTLACKRQSSATLQALVNKCKCDWNELVSQDFEVDDYSTTDLSKSMTAMKKIKKTSDMSGMSSDSKGLPNERNYLHVFAQNNNTEMLDVLLNGTTINLEAFDGFGKTPLHIAAENDNEEAVIRLVQGGAPCNIKDYNLSTPMHLSKSIRCARWIAAYGGRVDIANRDGVLAGSKWESELKACAKLWSSLQAKDAIATQVILDDSLWMEDELSQTCFLCGASFTFFLRKHHCRFCGLLCCGPCSTQKMDGLKSGLSSASLSSGKGSRDSSGGEKGLRSCDKCFAKGLASLTQRQAYEMNGKKWTVIPKTYLKMAVLEETRDAAIADVGSSSVPFTRKTGGASHASSATADTSSLRSTASKATGHTPSQSTGMTREVSAARAKAAANVEKTRIIADKSEDVRVQSEAFADMAKKLSEKYQ